MKWGALALAFLLGMAVDYWVVRPYLPRLMQSKTATKGATVVAAEDTAKKWEGGLETFGIKSGDLLISVNGLKDQGMFQELVDGYNRGKVCVLYERDEKKREVCWERK